MAVTAEGGVQVRLGSVVLTAERLLPSESPAASYSGERPSKDSAHFTLAGNAHCSIGDDDTVLKADRLHVMLEGAKLQSVTGIGNCRYLERDGRGLKASAEKMQLGDQGMQLDGQVRVMCPNGSAVAAETIRLSGVPSGKLQLQLMGPATLTLDDSPSPH